MKSYIIYILIALTIFSCKDEDKVEAEIAKLDVNVTIERFDKAFVETPISELPKLKKAFPFMFPKKYKDTFWIVQKQDTLQIELHKETNKAFNTLAKETLEIEALFKHLKYYFKGFKEPRVVTTTSSVDYINKVIVTDTITLISLDTYLGEKHHFYEGIQSYIRANMKPDQIVVDLAEKYAKKYIYQAKRKTLLDEFIYAGKILYFKDKMIPFKTDAEKIGYTEAQLDWARVNEEYIWRYFVDRELLYSTDSKLPNRFINPAPFSKFYLEEIDGESPGRIGQYIGWQIVRAFMKNNDVTLQEMLNETPENIFNKAKFKPRR
ncbi:gliding motility lipoprotein GldB [Pontimicrobium sp. MEBiC06410]